ncbi:MAG: proton-conducting transporter membrane subunit [Bacteroidales bacterium]|nr:proton-conducting transporter membrane subunit [Bacteroidales bacterium]MDD3810656.1 proton-conducting transporter membrane subunit [Bacteroidales bacterium]MDD4811813.1 proton-conducting transporter membrane subunit [Bacteroidales bacterium]
MQNLPLILISAILVVFVLPVRWKGVLALILVAAGVGITSVAVYPVLLSGETLTVPLIFPGMQELPQLVIDQLSAYFILIINFTSLTGMIYALGYLKPYYATKTPLRISIHFFSFFLLWLSMFLAASLQEAFPFLIVWELMTVSSFLLVIFDAEDRITLKAGINYLIQMHVGWFFLLVGFMISGQSTDRPGFDALSEYFAHNPNGLVFFLFFVGFGVKAGFIPLHTWLPQAHPAAPSHVSAVMSGVMIKMGIYGIFRVLTQVQQGLLTIGLIILAVSIVSGVLGVILAIAQHDLKRLLAYHSIENIGIIGIGIGLGVIGIATANPILAMLGFAGGLLHVLNHSLFKSLLFYNAGSVYLSTHTRNIEHLGGLIRKLPLTAIFFLIGALAICGLPPFNGFISEYLIYLGMFKSVSGSSLFVSLVILAALIGLVLIGGLAIFCFTKAYGVVFLGKPRKAVPNHQAESPWMMVPQVAIVVLIMAIGLFPVLFVRPLMDLVASSFHLTMPAWIFGTSLGDMRTISLLAGAFIALAVVIWMIRSLVLLRKPLARQDTWGCGYVGSTDRMQYTATSYADNLTTLTKPVLPIVKEMEPIEDEEFFPNRRTFATRQSDVIKKYLVDAPVDLLAGLLKKIAVMQTGQIRHYVLYAFLFMLLVFLLTFLNLI